MIVPIKNRVVNEGTNTAWVFRTPLGRVWEVPPVEMVFLNAYALDSNVL